MNPVVCRLNIMKIDMEDSSSFCKCYDVTGSSSENMTLLIFVILHIVIYQQGTENGLVLQSFGASAFIVYMCVLAFLML